LPEHLDGDTLVIKGLLAYAVKDAHGRTYNRTQYLKHRAAMMQLWEDYLDKLRKEVDALEFPLQVA